MDQINTDTNAPELLHPNVIGFKSPIPAAIIDDTMQWMSERTNETQEGKHFANICNRLLVDNNNNSRFCKVAIPSWQTEYRA